MIQNARQTRMRCYISSPLFVDTGVLRSVLHELDVEAGSIEEFPPAGQELIAVARAQIQTASFVVGVISGEQNGAVLFELGLAMGLGKTIFLIAESKDDLPSSMFGLPLVVAPVADRETLRFHLQAFLASLNLPRKAVAATPRPARHYGGGEAVPIQPTPGSAETEAEIRTQAAFIRAGAQVTVGPRFGTKSEADMIVWLAEPDLASIGPLLVEVKAKAKQPFPPKVMDQIRRLLESSHLRTALLVTDALDPGLTGRIIDGAYVYTISIAELERIAGAGQLGLELKRVRNLLAHGAA